MSNDTVVGYFGIILPASNLWQGLFINTGFDRSADDLLDKMRQDTRMRAQYVRGGDGYSGLTMEQGQMANALASTAVAAFNGTVPMPQYVLGAMGAAMRRVLKWDYFYVVGDQQADGHITTEIFQLEVDGVDAARDAINRLPMVQLAKLRMLTTLFS